MPEQARSAAGSGRRPDSPSPASPSASSATRGTVLSLLRRVRLLPSCAGSAEDSRARSSLSRPRSERPQPFLCFRQDRGHLVLFPVLAVEANHRFGSREPVKEPSVRAENVLDPVLL